jgi:heptosyltransferase I
MLSAVGDAVHVLPVVNALKRAWPESRVTWVIHPLPHSLVSGHRAVDRFVVFPRPRGPGAPGAFAALARDLRRTPFDLCLSLQTYGKAGLIQALSGARVRLGFDWRRARDLNWFANNAHIPARPDGHVQDQYFEFLRFLGVDPEPVVWGLEPTADERAAQARYFEALPGPEHSPVVGMVLAASDPRRNWSAEGYARVIEGLGERHGARCLLLGGPSEAEARIAAEVAHLCRGPLRPIDARGDGLRRLLWLIEGCDLVVGPDTGPLHMARAIGTPVVGLYGRTNPRRAGPYARYRDLLVDGYAEYPGEEYPPSRSYRDGMGRVTPGTVLEKVELGLGRYARPLPG